MSQTVSPQTTNIISATSAVILGEYTPHPSASVTEIFKNREYQVHGLATFLNAVQQKAEFDPTRQSLTDAATHLNSYLEGIGVIPYIRHVKSFEKQKSFKNKTYHQFIDELMDLLGRRGSSDEEIIRTSLDEMAYALLTLTGCNTEIPAQSTKPSQQSSKIAESEKTAHLCQFIIDVTESSVKLYIYSASFDIYLNDEKVKLTDKDINAGYIQYEILSDLMERDAEKLSKLALTYVDKWIDGVKTKFVNDNTIDERCVTM